jgi:hypothetical protein
MLPSPNLCDWCQTTVFNEHFLAMMKYTGTKGAPEVQGPFTMVHDIVAYYANSTWIPGFKGTFRQNSEVLLMNASQGCIFCMLLNNVRGGLLADFEFSIIVDSAWKWSEVIVAAETEEDEDRTGYFRVYETVKSTKLVFQGSTSGSLHIP